MAYQETFIRTPQTHEPYYTVESISRIIHWEEFRVKYITNPKCRVDGKPIVEHIRVRKNRMSYCSLYPQEALETFIKLSLLRKEGMALQDAISLLRENPPSIADILERSKDINRIIITKPDFYMVDKNKSL